MMNHPGTAIPAASKLLPLDTSQHIRNTSDCSLYYRSKQVSSSVTIEHVKRPIGRYNRDIDQMLFSFAMRRHQHSTYSYEGATPCSGPIARGECAFFPRQRSVNIQWFEETDYLNILVQNDLWSSVASEFGVALDGDIGVHTGVVDPLLAHFADLLLPEVDSEAPGSSVLIHSAVNAILVRFLRLYAGQARTEPAPRVPMWKIDQVRRYIDENLQRPLTLPELASLARMSTFHFARTFKEVTGHSPHSFIVSRRLEAAKSMLASDDLSIAQIAYRNGYETQSHFTKLFVRRFGITPKKFRLHALGQPALVLDYSPAGD